MRKKPRRNRLRATPAVARSQSDEKLQELLENAQKALRAHRSGQVTIPANKLAAWRKTFLVCYNELLKRHPNWKDELDYEPDDAAPGEALPRRAAECETGGGLDPGTGATACDASGESGAGAEL